MPQSPLPVGSDIERDSALLLRPRSFTFSSLMLLVHPKGPAQNWAKPSTFPAPGITQAEQMPRAPV